MCAHFRPESLFLMKREAPNSEGETEKVTSDTKTDGPDHLFSRVDRYRGPEFDSPWNIIIPNYNLKRTLFVYFFHRENIGHYAKKYPLSLFEFKVLKKFLIKKLIQDRRKFKILNIQNITHDNYTKFLLTNPAVYRKNIIKSKIFKKVVRIIKSQIPDYESKYIAEATNKNLEIFRDLDMKKAYNLMTNNFYYLCFSNSAFKQDFLRLINDPLVISQLISESKKKFVRKIDGWIDVLAQNLNMMFSLDEEESSIKVRLNTSRDEIEEARRCFLDLARSQNCKLNS